jgi:hypothetical protein
LRKEDLVTASGVMEGAARYVVGERLDNSGMRWIEERAEAVLLLRCIEVNGDWESFMKWSQEQTLLAQHHRDFSDFALIFTKGAGVPSRFALER